MTLKIFIIKCVWEPSGVEHITVIAENKEEAKEIALKDRYFNDLEIEEIMEVEIEKGKICSGNYCC